MSFGDFGFCLLRKKKKELAAAGNLAPIVMWCVGVALLLHFMESALGTDLPLEN